jgi:hypothetical protein
MEEIIDGIVIELLSRLDPLDLCLLSTATRPQPLASISGDVLEKYQELPNSVLSAYKNTI